MKEHLTVSEVFQGLGRVRERRERCHMDKVIQRLMSGGAGGYACNIMSQLCET